jgi:hypothetical protein
MAITHRLMVWQMIQADGEGVSARTPEEIQTYREGQSDQLETVVGDLSLSEEFDISGVKWYSLMDVLTVVNATLTALDSAITQAVADCDDKDNDLQESIDALEARIDTLEGYH